MGVYTSGGFAYTRREYVGVYLRWLLRTCLHYPPKNWDIYLRCYRQLPAVLKRAYPAGEVYLRWLLHRAWQDACHLDNYLRCYRLHGGCGFDFTSGGSCGCACNVPPIDWDIYLRCKNISYRARYRPLAKSERKAQGRKGHTKTAEEHGENGD